MVWLLYAIGLMLCGGAVSVPYQISQGLSEEADWFCWPGFIIGMGMIVVAFNLLGFITIDVLRRRILASLVQTSDLICWFRVQASSRSLFTCY